MPMLPDISAWLMDPTTEGVAADALNFVLRLVTFELAVDAAKMAVKAMVLTDEMPELADVDRLVIRDVFLEIFTEFVETDVDGSAGIFKLLTRVDKLVIRDVFLEMPVLVEVERLVILLVFLEIFPEFVLMLFAILASRPMIV